jgi:hypothetical protein
LNGELSGIYRPWKHKTIRQGNIVEEKEDLNKHQQQAVEGGQEK